MRLATIFIFFCFLGAAQETNSVKIGRSYSPNSRVQFQGFFGSNESHVFGVESEFGMRKLKSIFLTLFDANTLDRITSVDITPQDNEILVFEPVEIMTLNDAIFLISISNNKIDKSRLLVAHSVALNGELGEIILLDTLQTTKPVHTEFHLVTDSNEANLLVIQPLPFESFHNQKIRVKKFDSSLEQNWHSNFELPYKDKNMHVEQIYFDGEEKFVLLARQIVGIPVDLPNQVKENNKYHVIGYNHETGKLNEIELKLKDKWIRSLKLFVNESKIVVCGYYSNGNNQDVNGVFNLLLNSDYEITSAQLQKINVSELMAQNSNSIKLSNLVALRLIQLESGKMALVGERHYKEVSPRYDARTDLTSYSDMYHYLEIVVTLFEDNGDLIQHFLIPKYQVTNNDYGTYSSVFVAQSNNKVHIFYNDTERNKELPLSNYDNYRGMTNYRKNYGVHIMISDLGVIQKTMLYDSDLKINFRPSMAGQTRDGSIYFLGERLKQSRVLKLVN